MSQFSNTTLLPSIYSLIGRVKHILGALVKSYRPTLSSFPSVITAPHHILTHLDYSSHHHIPTVLHYRRPLPVHLLRLLFSLISPGINQRLKITDRNCWSLALRVGTEVHPPILLRLVASHPLFAPSVY